MRSSARQTARPIRKGSAALAVGAAGLTVALSGGCTSGARTAGSSAAGTRSSAPGQNLAPLDPATTSPTISPTTSPATSPTKPNSLPDACTADQLTTQWIGSDKTGGGHMYATIVLNNKSTSACWLSGVVGMTIIAADQTPINTPIRLPTDTVRVELEPGGSAAALADFGSDHNPPPGQTSCSPTMAVFRIVIAESGYSPEVPGWHIPHCPADTITISALVAGTTAPQP